MTEADASRLPLTGSVTVKVLIPNYLAGALIGKGGEELNIIRKQTGGIIKLSQNKAYYPGTDERVVLIKGRPDSAFSLLKLVHSKIRTRKAPPVINGRPFNEVRLQQMKLVIANSTAGKIIGTGGEVIKMLQQDHNVKLFITNVENPKEKRIQNERICTIKGDELSVNKCMIDLVERIASDELADLDTNIDYPKCEDSEIIFGLERPVILPGMGLVPGIGLPIHGGMNPSYEELYLLQEQSKAIQAMAGGNQLLQLNPMVQFGGLNAVNGNVGGLANSNGLPLVMDPFKRLLGPKQEVEILSPEMAMIKNLDGTVVVDQYADSWPKHQGNIQMQQLLLQNPTLAAQQAAKAANDQLVAAQTQADQYNQLLANQFNPSVGGLGKRFTASVATSQQQHQQELLNRNNGITTSAIYQSPLMTHVATSNPIAAQTAAIQAAQNAALQQQIQLQALQQATPNPYISNQTSSLQALQDAQQQLQAAQLQAIQAQANQLHSNPVAHAQLHAQVQAQLLMNQNAAHSANHGGKQSKRYHPYSVPPPPPPPGGDMLPTQSIAPQIQAPPTTATKSNVDLVAAANVANKCVLEQSVTVAVPNSS